MSGDSSIGIGIGLALKSYGRAVSYVKIGRVLDLTTPFSELTFTLDDKSGEGNDATLYSGRYISTDGSTDRGIVADCSAAGAGSYYLTGKVRPNAVTTAELTMDGSTDSGLTGLTADVWQTFTTATSAVTPSAVQVGYDGSTASAADWSDVRLIDSSDGSTVARWQLNESADGDLNGYPALDSNGNGYHGTHVGCAGGTGETTILQTAGMDWNKRMWFDGVDDYVEFPIVRAGKTDIDIHAKVAVAKGSNGFVLFSGSNGGVFIGIGQEGSANTSIISNATGTVTIDGVTVTTRGEIYSALADGEVHDFVVTGADITNFANDLMRFGFWSSASLFMEGIGYDIVIYDSDGTTKLHEWAGYGNTNSDWLDTIGSNNGTVNGSPSNYLIPASDATPTNDALGNAIAEPRPTSDTWNLFGDGEYGVVADADSLDVTTEASWEIWGNFYGVQPSNMGIFSKWDFGSDQRSWRIGKQSTTLADGLHLFLSTNGIVAVGTNIPAILADTTQHLVITYDAGTLLTYIDGALVATDTSTVTSIFSSTAVIQIGANGVDPPTEFYDDKISRPKIYNRALTADEVLKNYNAQKGAFGL